MKEKDTGIWVMKYSFPRWVLEVLAITQDEVIVARPKGGKGVFLGQALGGLVGAGIALVADKRERKKEQPTLAELLKTDKKSLSIPRSEITDVRLEKSLAGVRLNMITRKKKYKWYAKSLDLSSRPSAATTAAEAEFGDFENLLQQAFPDKLTVKK